MSKEISSYRLSYFTLFFYICKFFERFCPFLVPIFPYLLDCPLKSLSINKKTEKNLTPPLENQTFLLFFEITNYILVWKVLSITSS